MKHLSDVVVNQFNIPLAFASVQVNVHGGGAANIFSDDGITAAPNPITCDGQGRLSFYAADGRYDLIATSNGITTTVSDVEIADILQASATDASWVSEAIQLVNQTTLAPIPPAGRVVIYSKASDKGLFYRDETGVETGPLGTGGGGGGGGTPGGSNTQVQFNDAGSFGGDSTFTYNKTLKLLTNSGSTYLGDGQSSFDPNIQNYFGSPDRTAGIGASFGSTTSGFNTGLGGMAQSNNAAVSAVGVYGATLRNTTGTGSYSVALEGDAIFDIPVSTTEPKQQASIYGFAQNVGLGTVTTLSTVYSQLVNSAGATVTNAYVFDGEIDNVGTVGTAAFYHVPVVSGIGGTLNAGVLIENQGSGAKDYAINIRGGKIHNDDYAPSVVVCTDSGKNLTTTGCPSSGGSSAFSALTAATAANTVNNGNNQQTWEWTLTSSSIGLGIVEGVPSTAANSFLVDISTGTGSTAIPLVVSNNLSGSQNLPTMEIQPQWNTTGSPTGLLVNALTGSSGAASKLIDAQLSGTSKWNVDKSGNTLQVGTASISGSSSGTVSVGVQASAGTYNFNLPTTAGTAGQVLTSQGGGAAAMTWTSTSGVGTVTSIATSSPITGGTITSTGTIACATCSTNASALTSGRLLLGGGGQAIIVGDLIGDVTTSGNHTATINNITNSSMLGKFDWTGITAPASATAGHANVFVDSTNLVLSSKNSSGVVSSTVVPNAGTTHQWFSALSAAGVLTASQPAFTDISGTLLLTQIANPSTNGDVVCASGGVWTECSPGRPIDAQTVTTYAWPAADREFLLTTNNSSAIAVSLAQAGTAGFGNNWNAALYNLGAGLVTLTPATSTVNGASTQTVPKNYIGFLYSDNTNYLMPVVPTLPVIQKLPTVQACGTTSSCAATSQSNAQIVYGSAALVSGAPSTVTITGISPAFTSSSSYICTVAAQSGATAALLSVANVSGSSFTITGPATSTTVINYHCIGV